MEAVAAAEALGWMVGVAVTVDCAEEVVVGLGEADAVGLDGAWGIDAVFTDGLGLGEGEVWLGADEGEATVFWPGNASAGN